MVNTVAFLLATIVTGNSNPELEKRIQKDLDEFLEKHPGVKAEDVPSDLLLLPVQN